MTADEVIDSIDFKFYATTEGCYIVSDEFNNLVVAHRCKKEAPNNIDLDGSDLMIRFLTGDMKYLINQTEGIDYIVFERLHDPENYRMYKSDRLRSIINSRK